MHQLQIGIGPQGVLHGLFVEIPIHLRPRSPHRRSLAPIQDAVVNARLVGRGSHDALQGIDFAHQVSLADSANRGIARQFAHRVEALRDEGRAGSRARGGGGGLAPRVPTAHDNHVKL